jgi:hypothetical protein
MIDKNTETDRSGMYDVLSNEYKKLIQKKTYIEKDNFVFGYT